MDYFQLLRAHQGYLERIALAMLGNRPDAEDALQEAALAGYRRFAQLRDEQAFGAWMRRILIRQCRQILERRRRSFPVDDLAAHLPDTVPGPDPEATAIWEMVARLGDHLRPVVVLRYMLDMSQQEIAEALGIPLGTVKSRLGKALPLVGPVITRFILAGAGLQWAYDMGLIGEPVAEVTQNGITVRILGVVADARRTTVLYQVLGAPSTVGRGRQPRVPVHATITAQMSEFTPPEETPLGYLGTVSTLPLEAEAAELEVRFDVGAETITLTVPASRTETDRFSREVAVNRALEYDGVRITVEAVIYTPAETIVRYREEVTESFDFPVQWDGDVHCNYLEAGGQRYRQSGSGGGLNSVSYLAFPPVRGPARLVLKPAVKAEPLDAVWPLEEGAVAEVVGVPVTLAGIERRPGAIELSWTSPVREGFVGVSGFEVIDGEGNVYPLGGSWAGFSNYTHDGVRYQRYETELPEGLEPVAVRATKAGVLVDGPWVFDLPG
ncbi:sigma-70 family RNA polymerase sigma factor [Symbiobacterium thermophilum]|uniref:RNA polymerase ECF-type sigma factor variant n=1 Tax=Symbiobacterium thermophilum (strain DSM 24528 / JCM 14929 / IAM 14863 / T) TaxID=292459 RepID=Q67KB3_SYMTH|nr:sigma-70 family RNA polymerase sigma factor [Symbiobacterium thermophilum]BAD41885.1 RNA polymerase ECF-type sigma factor variant [Symbiobacterium thermophilum IAM 14863]